MTLRHLHKFVSKETHRALLVYALSVFSKLGREACVRDQSHFC